MEHDLEQQIVQLEKKLLKERKRSGDAFHEAQLKEQLLTSRNERAPPLGINPWTLQQPGNWRGSWIAI